MKEKKLNLFDLTSIGVGCVIGAGIFSMLGIGISYTGRSIAFSIVLSMLIYTITYMPVIFLSGMFALDGGMYAMYSLMLPPTLTGMLSLMLLINNFTLSIFGLSISSYLSQLFPVLAPYQKIIAFVITTLAFASTLKGSSFMAKIQNVMVVCMYAALALFVIYGIINRDPATLSAEPYFYNGTGGFLSAIAVMTYTCNGALSIVGLTADTGQPKKTIPKAIILTSLICALLYFLLAFASTGALPYEKIAGQNLGVTAESVMPKAAYIFFVLGGAVFALGTTLMGTISTLRYPLLAAAEDGWLPSVAARKTKDGLPYVIVLFTYIVSVIPIIFDFTFDALVSFIMVPNALIGIVVCILAFRLPERFPAQWEQGTLRCPHWIFRILIVVSALCNLFVAVFSLAALDRTTAVGNIVVTLTFFIYCFLRNKSGKVNLNAIESIKIQAQKQS